MANTILLVEDEEGLSSYLTTELQFENYTIILATDGKQALDTYESMRGAT